MKNLKYKHFEVQMYLKNNNKSVFRHATLAAEKIMESGTAVKEEASKSKHFNFFRRNSLQIIMGKSWVFLLK